MLWRQGRWRIKRKSQRDQGKKEALRVLMLGGLVSKGHSTTPKQSEGKEYFYSILKTSEESGTWPKLTCYSEKIDVLYLAMGYISKVCTARDRMARVNRWRSPPGPPYSPEKFSK